MPPSESHPPLPTVNGWSFQDEVLREGRTVLVEVSAAHCAPCRAAEPVLRAMAAELQARLKVVKIDADEAPDLIAQLNVRGFPTFLVFANGSEVARRAGYSGPRPLRALLGVDGG